MFVFEEQQLRGESKDHAIEEVRAEDGKRQNSIHSKPRDTF
jgi:hypothetical protein